MCWPFVSFFVVWNTFSLSASFTRLPKSWVYFPHKFTIGRNLRRLLWNWLVAWVSVLTNVKSTHAICALVSGYWGCKKWPRDHVWVVRQKHCKCQGNQTEFFLHFLQNLANCAENVTTQTHRQSKQNVCFKKQVPRWVYCLFASSALLHCANIASIRIRRKEYDVLGLFVTLLLVYLFIVIQKFSF